MYQSLLADAGIGIFAILWTSACLTGGYSFFFALRGAVRLY